MHYYWSCRQIEIDSKFLEIEKIMDYSLLLGVHYRAPQHLRSHQGLAVLAEEGQCWFLYIGLFRFALSILLPFQLLQRKLL